MRKTAPGHLALVPKEPLPKVMLRLLQPTASKTDLYLACAYPWGKTVEEWQGAASTEPATGGATFGSAFHEVMAKGLPDGCFTVRSIKEAAQKFTVDPGALGVRIEAGFHIVYEWLNGDNQWKIPFRPFGVEQSVAYNPITDTARVCQGPTEDGHRYLDREPGEIPGTIDVGSLVVIKGEDTVLVLDHKSGWKIASDWQPQTPAESGQLRTLALGLARLHGARRAIVAFFHAPAGSPPQVYADILTAADLEKHRQDLLRADGLVGKNYMRPGPHCPDCPIFTSCPTQSTSLAELKHIGELTAERVGAIHQATAEYDKLRDKLRGELRAWIKANGAAVRPDGQYVDLFTKEMTNLSQASIIRALGELKGKGVIQKLTKLGCVETRSQEELRAVKR
jgi:hypothetical protein